MKILDRYVLRLFLWNYLISFVVLIGMYIVLDMVFNFDELVSAKPGVTVTTVELIMQIGDYYFHQMFLIFVHLSGIIPVVAAGFTLIRLSRFNELAAILAAGVPLLRVATPVILASVVLQGLLAVDQEVIIPSMIPKLAERHEDLLQQSSEKAYPILAMQDSGGGLLFVGRYYPASEGKPTMSQVDIIERDDQLNPVSHVVASGAVWDPGNQQWNLTDGKRITGLLPDQTRSAEIPTPTYKSDVTPDEISLYHSSQFVNLLSRDKIDQLIQNKRVYGTLELLRVKHFRLAQLLMNIVMLLVAIPCVLSRDPSRLKTSIFQCLVLMGLCMGSFFVAFQIAGFPPAGATWADKWPAMLAFAPILVWGVVAVVLLDTMPS